MYKYDDELLRLDKELNKYHKNIERFNIRSAIRLVKRVRSGISIKDEKLFIDIPDMDRYIFLKWLNKARRVIGCNRRYFTFSQSNFNHACMRNRSLRQR